MCACVNTTHKCACVKTFHKGACVKIIHKSEGSSKYELLKLIHFVKFLDFYKTPSFVTAFNRASYAINDASTHI